jgi:tripartite-type tricarboxylate transporter receptor subunit TctC
MQHVPFKAASELFTAVGNGDVQWSFGSIASSQAAFRYGKVRYLAVAAPRRLAAMPEVPTVAEAGGPAALDVNSFVVLMAPRGVAPGIAARVGAEMARASADAELRTRRDTFAFEPIVWSPEEITRHAETKAKVYGELIRRADIRLE